MPENNPFEAFPETKSSSNLSTREKLFADMGLSPQAPSSNPVLTDDFLQVGFTTDTANPLTTLTEPATTPSKHTELVEENDKIVDAIFTSTQPPEPTQFTPVPEAFTAQPTEHDSVLPELTAALQTESEPATTADPVTRLEGVSAEHSDQPELKVESALVETTANAPETLSVLKSLDRVGLAPIVDAYTDLQQKLVAHQTLISAEREAIATLRNQMRQLNARGHDMSETWIGLDQGRQLVQVDSCENLIRSISQINEVIQQDSQHAVQLIAPIKTGVEILELRVKHISAIENLLVHMQEGLKLQEQLAGANTLIHNLAKQLGLNFTQA